MDGFRLTVPEKVGLAFVTYFSNHTQKLRTINSKPNSISYAEPAFLLVDGKSVYSGRNGSVSSRFADFWSFFADSEFARSILIGWQSHTRAMRMLQKSGMTKKIAGSGDEREPNWSSLCVNSACLLVEVENCNITFKYSAIFLFLFWQYYKQEKEKKIKKQKLICLLSLLFGTVYSVNDLNRGICFVYLKIQCYLVNYHKSIDKNIFLEFSTKNRYHFIVHFPRIHHQNCNHHNIRFSIIYHHKMCPFHHGHFSSNNHQKLPPSYLCGAFTVYLL